MGLRVSACVRREKSKDEVMKKKEKIGVEYQRDNWSSNNNNNSIVYELKGRGGKVNVLRMKMSTVHSVVRFTATIYI